MVQYRCMLPRTSLKLVKTSILLLCLVDSPGRKVWKGRIWCLRMCLFTRNRLWPWRRMLLRIARWTQKFTWVCRFKILRTPTQPHSVWNIISSPLHRFVFFAYMAPFTLKIKSHETRCSEMFWSLKRGDILVLLMLIDFIG